MLYVRRMYSLFTPITDDNPTKDKESKKKRLGVTLEDIIKLIDIDAGIPR